MEEAEWLGAVEDDDERDRARGMPRSRSSRGGGGMERVVGASGGYGLGFPQSGDMEEGSGAPAGPAWLAQWPAGPRPSEGGGLSSTFFLSYFLLFIFCLVVFYFVFYLS